MSELSNDMKANIVRLLLENAELKRERNNLSAQRDEAMRLLEITKRERDEALAANRKTHERWKDSEQLVDQLIEESLSLKELCDRMEAERDEAVRRALRAEHERSEAIEQANRDAARADANAALCSKWRVCAEKLAEYAYHSPFCKRETYGLTGDCDCSVQSLLSEFERLKEGK